MKETFRLVVTLAVFCALAGFLLAWVNVKTKEPIEAAQKAKFNNDNNADAYQVGTITYRFVLQ